MSDDLKKAKLRENAYFEKIEAEAKKRIKEKLENEKVRLSPVSGNPLVPVNMSGVIVDQCPDSGGVWLDKGELEELIKISSEKGTDQTWLDKFVDMLSDSVK